MSLTQEQIETLTGRLRPYIDAAGLHVPEYATIRSTLVSAWRGIFGDDLYVEPDSQDGQLIAVFAMALLDTYQALEDIYLGFSPNTAMGENLSRVVKINGIRRKTGSHSTVDVRIVGVPGTTITSGVVRSVAGNRWNLPTEVFIPVAGEVTVTATAQEEGDIAAAADEVNEIATPTRGWQSVNNPAAATAGTNAESDAELRQRQAYSVALPSRTIFAGTLGAVANVEGVQKYTGFENDSDETDTRGSPAHSIAVIVQGGDTQEIASAILHKKTPGCGTFGTTSETITDEDGFTNTIRFSRPVSVPLKAQIMIKAETGYVSSIGDDIRAAVVKYVESLMIGQTGSVSPIVSAAVRAGSFYDVSSVQIAKSSGTLAGDNIPMAFNELASLEVDDVELVVNS